MKQSISVAFIAVLSVAHAAAPTAEDILAKAREALGGPKLAGAQSLVVSGDFSRAMYTSNESGDAKGQPEILKGELELNILLPDKFLKAETMALPNGIPGPTILECLNGDQVWNDTQSPHGMMIRIGNLERPEADRRRELGISFTRFLLAFLLGDRPATPITFTYVGEAEAPDGRADVLDAKGPDNFATRIYFDQKTHHPLMLAYRGSAVAKARMMMVNRGPGGPGPDDLKRKLPPPETREVDIQIRLSDYRKESGVSLPHLLSWSSEGATTDEFEIKKFSINCKLDAGKFRK
jgi:hypothetical protein